MTDDAESDRRQLQTIKQSLAAADVEFIQGQFDEAAVSYVKALGLAKGFSAKEQAEMRWKETFLHEVQRRVRNVTAFLAPEKKETFEEVMRAKARAAGQEVMPVGMSPEEIAAARKERQESLMVRCTMITDKLNRARALRDASNPPRARSSHALREPERPNSPVIALLSGNVEGSEVALASEIESAKYPVQETTTTYQQHRLSRSRVRETSPAISYLSSPEERYSHLGKPIVLRPPAENGSFTAKELRMIQELEGDAKKAQKPLNYYAAPWGDELFMESDVQVGVI